MIEIRRAVDELQTGSLRGIKIEERHGNLETNNQLEKHTCPEGLRLSKGGATTSFVGKLERGGRNEAGIPDQGDCISARQKDWGTGTNKGRKAIIKEDFPPSKYTSGERKVPRVRRRIEKISKAGFVFLAQRRDLKNVFSIGELMV